LCRNDNKFIIRNEKFTKVKEICFSKVKFLNILVLAFQNKIKEANLFIMFFNFCEYFYFYIFLFNLELKFDRCSFVKKDKINVKLACSVRGISII